MSQPQPRLVPLAGSERPSPGGEVVGPVDPQAPVEVSVVVRRAPGAAEPTPGRVLSRAEFAAAHGAASADLDAVAAYARASGLQVTGSDRARRTVGLAGPAAAMGAAFGVDLVHVDTAAGGTHRGRSGPVHVPAALVGVVEAVLGLDDRAQAHTRLVVFDPAAHGPAVRAFTPVEVGARYAFPAGLDGTGQTVAVIELGGGLVQGELDQYAAGLGLPAPQVVTVGVDGGANAPTGSPDGPDGEVMLDVEVIGALAPGARQVVYFAPNTDRGFLDAVTTAIHDDTHRPSVVSISWGGAESSWTRQALTAFDGAFADAGALGVTVCVASGDDGSSDRVTDGRAHVDFPASSPHVLACGGTRLTSTDEVVWGTVPGRGAGGGGVSERFPLPGYQQGAGVPPTASPSHRHGRGVPDVAGDADPATGYLVRADGQDLTVGGTSAVAPLWAALLARVNQARAAAGTPPVGFVHPALYAGATSGAFRDITVGTNGAYSAGPGWDACTGLGSPVGSALLTLLT